VAYAYEGWGLLDKPAVAALTRVLLGERAAPARAEMARWADLAHTARASRWGAEPAA
jgi:hypothetical protein